MAIADSLRWHEPFLHGSSPPSSQRCCCLEIGSGTGQHVALLAKIFAHVDFQPTEYAGGCPGPKAPPHGSLDPIFTSILTHVGSLPNVRKPLALDAAASRWPEVVEASRYDAIFCCKVLHIAPWDVTRGLLSGSSRVLKPGGRLFIYGAFLFDGKHTCKRNVDFDARLREQNAEWGVRDATAIAHLAEESGLVLAEREALPDDDFMLIFRKS